MCATNWLRRWAKRTRPLNLAAQPRPFVLMAGLQGAGKTTSVGKLGKFLREKHKKKVLVVSADVYRPAGDQTAGNPGAAG
ncbi:signal recognition particle protein [Citrobacter koseri]|uniref:Signal recognition particle protein n=1 Tax=Citrobacter koseri TaxID=545 RepID=A0A2X2WNG8_CITKO|nr:signal recognition particle protein [Citrobacter koseri]